MRFGGGLGGGRGSGGARSGWGDICAVGPGINFGDCLMCAPPLEIDLPIGYLINFNDKRNSKVVACLGVVKETKKKRKKKRCDTQRGGNSYMNAF